MAELDGGGVMGQQRYPSYESTPTLEIINDRCESLPACPVCGGLTNMDAIRIELAGSRAGAHWIGYVLRCLNSVDPFGLRRGGSPLCTFAIPMTLKES